MASIEILPSELVVHIRGWDKILAMRGTLRIPLTHVLGARARPREAYFDEVLIETQRGVGTYVRGKVAAGLVYSREGPCFYDVREASRAIAIDVHGESIRRIVVELDDESPEEAAQRVERATLGARRRTHPAAELRIAAGLVPRLAESG